jgi:LysR family hydrogen peroxide-inducible transcriptional activator
LRDQRKSHYLRISISLSDRIDVISTRQLRYFEALARFEHFGRAAEHCAVTQPALSMQIIQLERELGVTLVERRPNGAVLTGAGQEVARRAAEILLGLRGLAEFAASCQAPLSSPLRLGVIPTVAPYLLPLLLPHLRDQYPGLELLVRETLTGTLVADLVETGLDLLLVALPVDHPDIETMVIGEDRFLLAVPAGRPGEFNARVSLDALDGERLLLLDEGHCLRDQALAACRLAPREGAGTLGASSLATLVHLVASGFGVTLLPEISGPYESQRGGIRLLRFADPEPRRVLGLAWRRSSPRKLEFTLFGEVIREVWSGSGEPAQRNAVT